MIDRFDKIAYRLSNKTLRLVDKCNLNYRCNVIINECITRINISRTKDYSLDFSCEFDNIIEAHVDVNVNFQPDQIFYADLLELYRHELHHVYQHLYEDDKHTLVNESELDLFRLYEVDAHLYGFNLRAQYLREHLIETVQKYIDSFQCETEGFDKDVIKDFWLKRAQTLQLI